MAPKKGLASKEKRRGVAFDASSIAPATSSISPSFLVAYSDKALSRVSAIGHASGIGFSAPGRFPILEPVSVFAVDSPAELEWRV